MGNRAALQAKETILNCDEYVKSLLGDLENAKRSIELETYIFNEDSFGKKIIDVLIKAASRGVKVRLLLDGIGTSSWYDGIRKMEEGGVKVRVFNPFPLKLWQLNRTHFQSSIIFKIIYFFLRMNSRNHRKTCIIDGAIVYVGSINITQSHFSFQQGGEGWIDAVVKVTQVDLQELQFAFDIAWYGFSLNERIKKIFKPVKKNPVFRLNYFRRQRRLLYKSLLQQIFHCQHRVWMMSAYFNPDYFLLRYLKKAAKRGRDVKILLPHDPDVAIMSLFANAFYSSLLQGGVKIYEYLPSVIHAKMLIIDDWYCIGSSNLTQRSLIHDLEVDVNIQTNSAKKILEKQFLDVIQGSRQLSLEDLKKLPLYKKMLSQLLLYIRYFF
ncbi:MAG: hypothetical protein ACD_45C00739G0005 [uncultured bacterium]|nr:MAG: hypothetical protein ACD_45C00739G0005 [uncultured bacterium]